MSNTYCVPQCNDCTCVVQFVQGTSVNFEASHARLGAQVTDPRPFSQGIGVDFRDKAPSAADDTHEEWGARLDLA